ncbi:MAG: hypothetical protein EBX50_14465 [Chitinophagia bacterium]|nr:hypothetical protein [Chitinophagia bacterium]
MSNDPRCYPAKVLGEYREYLEYAKQKDAQDTVVKKLLSDSKKEGWTTLQKGLRMLKNTIKGSQIFSMNDDLPPEPTPEPEAKPTNPTAKPIIDIPHAHNPQQFIPLMDMLRIKHPRFILPGHHRIRVRNDIRGTH